MIEDKLALHPHESVKLLIAQLHVVPDTPFVRWEIRTSSQRTQAHVVWCIRALRYLTGQHFEASTHLPLKEPDEGWAETILYGENHPKDRSFPIPFAAEWPSRGQICIAPVDAQEAIIAQWKTWLSVHPDFDPAMAANDQTDWYY